VLSDLSPRIQQLPSRPCLSLPLHSKRPQVQISRSLPRLMM